MLRIGLEMHSSTSMRRKGRASSSMKLITGLSSSLDILTFTLLNLTPLFFSL